MGAVRSLCKELIDKKKILGNISYPPIRNICLFNCAHPLTPRSHPFNPQNYDRKLVNWRSIKSDTMVQLTEVVDEHFQEGQAGPEEEDDFTDTGTSFLFI